MVKLTIPQMVQLIVRAMVVAADLGLLLKYHDLDLRMLPLLMKWLADNAQEVRQTPQVRKYFLSLARGAAFHGSKRDVMRICNTLGMENLTSDECNKIVEFLGISVLSDSNVNGWFTFLNFMIARAGNDGSREFPGNKVAYILEAKSMGLVDTFLQTYPKTKVTQLNLGAW